MLPVRMKTTPNQSTLRGWLVDLVIGGLTGGVVGAIVAVNVVIFAGPETGYEASLAEVFDHSPVVGGLTVAALVGGPVLGVGLARRLRRQPPTAAVPAGPPASRRAGPTGGDPGRVGERE